MEITCASCAKPNSLAAKFCGACGARLWEPCLGCGESNSIAERFCSQCGRDLRRAVEEALARLDAKLQQATLLESEGNLLEAIECLAGVPAEEHSALAARVADVARLREELIGKRNAIVSNLQERILEAQRLQQERRYAQAREQLLRIPASLRGQQARGILAEVEQTLHEISLLRAHVREALKQGQAIEALSDVERLRELEPHADDVGRLWQQLSQQRRQVEAALAKKLLKQARDAVAANDYLSADSYLKRIPASAVDGVRELFDAIRERAWLARQIMTAPYADPTLLAIAARLAKLQPKDATAAQWHHKIKERLSRADTRDATPLVPWAKPIGPQPALPMEPVLNLSGVQCDSSNARTDSWHTDLRRHLVSFGLALVGIGRARFDFDLRPSRGSWLERLSQVGNLRRPTAAWGLDFGTSGLKVLRLSVNKEGVVAIDASGIISYDRPTTATEAADVQAYLYDALAEFIDRFQPGDEPLVVSFPGPQTLGRFFTLPRLSQERRFQKALECEIRNQIPIPLDEVVYAADRATCDAQEDVAAPLERVTVLAAKRSHCDLRTAPFAGSDVTVHSLQSECVALVNVLHHSYADELSELTHEESLALVEVGDAATNVVVASHRGPCFRTLHHGMRVLNKRLVKHLGITFQQADQLRQRWAQADVMCRVDDALLPAFEEFTRTVKHALDACAESTDTRVVRLLVAGGGGNQFGLLRSWSQSDELVGDDRWAQPKRAETSDECDKKNDSAK